MFKSYSFKFFVIIVLLIIANDNFAQSLSCSDASANVLCSLGELDDFSGTMPSSNPNDEPAPFCNGSGNPQNMSWFAFIAGSSSAVLELVTSNCNNGSTIQYGIYTDCGYGESIICQGNAVNANGTIDLNLNGMIPGDDYFFFIDGDLGTYCDYAINVVSGGDPIPVPDPTGIDCIGSNCPINDNAVCLNGETYTFQVQGLDLSIDYMWSINPLPSGFPANPQTINGNNEISLTFNETGDYTICLTATNGCTTTSEVCTTLNIIEPDAGTITASLSVLCPGATTLVTVADWIATDNILIAVDPDGTVISWGEEQLDITAATCTEITVYSWSHFSAENPPLPINSPFVLPDCNAYCCDITSIVISFEDNEAPEFNSPPVDITLDCGDVIPPLEDLSWMDNCDGTGMVSPVEEENYTVCDGGVITRLWKYVDVCNNIGEHTQTITVNGQSGGVFANTPVDLNVDCMNDIPPTMDLTWTGECNGTASVSSTDDNMADMCNGGQVLRTWSYTDMCGGLTEYTQVITVTAQSGGVFLNTPSDITIECDDNLSPIQVITWMGDCDGNVTVLGTETDNSDICNGGNITRFWTYTDDCNNTVDFTQNITVNPPAEPTYINPPGDQFLNCDEIPSTFPDLMLSNNLTGNCLIEGTAIAEIVGDPTICGGNISIIWIFTDPCNRVITNVQNITIIGADAPGFIDPPIDETISCVESFPSSPDLDYTNNMTDGCEIAGTVVPVVSTEGDICGGDIVSIWEFTDECGVTISHTQIITIEPIGEPMFLNPPIDVILDCTDAAITPVDLDYTNMGMDACEIMGTISPIVSGTADICGGDIMHTWEFIDQCGRTINYTQNVTVLPASEASFINPPSDITIGCDAIPPMPPNLSYSNGENANCIISGEVSPTVNDNSNSCGGTIQYIWEFVDDCSRMISYSQLITITQAPEASYLNTPMNMTVTCDNIPVPATSLSYSNNDACSIMGTIDPIIDNQYDICGGTITNTWDFTDECGRLLSHVQIITIDPSSQASFISNPGNETVSCASGATVPSDLMYSNGLTGACAIEGAVSPVQSGSYDACGGEINFTWEFTDDCSRVIQWVKTVVVEPAAVAEFTNPPLDITVSCANYNATPILLTYTNNEFDNCLISGSIAGSVIGSPNPCGTTVTHRWEFTDICGRTITYNQQITIEEAPEPAFTSLPDDIIVDCDAVSGSVPSLAYTNGANGICAITGNVNGIQSGSYNECGGSISYSWTFTDACNRTISHSQNVTVNPASDPMFIDPPVDITLDCGDVFPPDPSLSYTNSATGACEISGSVIATSTTNGSVTTYTWEYVNTCNNVLITHMQDVTGISTPEISINPSLTSICLGESYDLSEIIVDDINGNTLTITFADASGTSILSSIVSPIVSTTYTIIGTNSAGCSDEAIFTIDIETPPNAGGDGAGSLCGDFSNYNLFEYLVGGYDTGGTWFDTDNSGANIDNPTSAKFNNVVPGTYVFTYTVFSSNSCPDDEAIITIEVIGDLFFEIISATCDPGAQTYTIVVSSNGYNIVSSEGDINVIDGNTVNITNIPAETSVLVSAIDPVSFCISDIFVNAPDCDCPSINAPVSGGDISICEGEEVPELSASADAGLSINWYDMPSGGTPLATMTNTYTPIVINAGIYTYYLEAIDSDGCINLIREPIILTINEQPIVNIVTVATCEEPDGSITVVLQDVNSMINSNASFTFEYYNTMTGAESGSNPLGSEITINNNTTIFVSVLNGAGCTNISELTLEINAIPEFDTEIKNETCFDNDNGSLILSNIIPSNTTFSFDNITFEDYNSIDTLSAGTYVLYALSDQNCIKSLPFDIIEGLKIDITDVSIICSDNGTASNSSDDIYNVSFTVVSTPNSSGMVHVTTDTNDFGMFDYGAISITFDANGSNQTIVVTDVDSGCSDDIETGDLISCSTNCEITIDELIMACDGNGTPTDPIDDVYNITINASVINGASNNTFNVQVDGAIVASFEYGIGGVISISAQGQNAIITISDNEDQQCFVTENIGPLTPCSNQCILNLDNQNFICDNNGTIGVNDDDFYNFSFLVFATNTTATMFEVMLDGSSAGLYNYGTIGMFDIPADGLAHMIDFIDVDNPDCQLSIDSPVLDACSGNCTVTSTVESSECFNEGTGDDESDDTFTAVVSVDLVGGSGMWEISGTTFSGSSGEMVVVGPYLISDGDVTLSIIDSGVSGCETSIDIVAPSSCSSCNESVESGENQELDCDITSVMLLGTSSNLGNGSWTIPGGMIIDGYSIEADLPGKYFFIVDFGDSCVRTDSLEITVSNDIPIINIEPHNSLTCIIDSTILTAIVTGGSGNFSYKWMDKDMLEIASELSIVVYQSGNFFFSVLDLDTDCESPPILATVIQNTNIPNPVISANPGNVLDCSVELIYLTNNEEGNVDYTWYVNDLLVTDSEVTIDEASNVMLIAIDTLSGCIDSSELVINNIEAYPIVNIEDVGTLSCITSAVTIDGSASQSGSDITYTWLDENGNTLATDITQLDVNLTGTYYLQLVDESNGCTNIDSVEIFGDFNYPNLDVENNTEIDCDITVLEMVADIQNTENSLIMWSTTDGNIVSGENMANVLIDMVGTYYISVIDITSQCEVLDTIEVVFASTISSVSIDIMDESCGDNADGILSILSIDGGNSPYSYFIDGVEIIGNEVSNLDEGSYLVSIVDDKGCDFDTTIVIETIPLFEIDLEAEISLTTGNSGQLIAAVNIAEDEIETIQWTPSIGLSCDTCLVTSLTAGNQDQVYTIGVTDVNGCYSEATIQLLTEAAIIVTVPNIINVNGNNNNSNFTIYSNEEGAVISKLEIFDRWGSLMFNIENIPVNNATLGWDGTYNGTKLVPGVYVYLAEIIIEGQEKILKSGDITLLN